ncbi:hypothetical protein [Rhodopseudomonas palustris]|uniref:Uncharacterized protein n=1 Tax=Rhodopseudomonas palustris (strain BisB18) TaxID=316056 RepID=Q214J4_RHOPB
MATPRNVQLFEALLYASLGLDALSVAFQDRTPTAEISDGIIMAANLIAAGLIVALVYLVWLAAQQRKNWPRWVLTGSLALSAVSLAQIIGDSGLQFDSWLEIVSTMLTATGLYLSFTGDAKDWFNQ